MSLIFSHARPEHIEGILQLQAANLLAKMPVEKQGDGFVTTAITAAQYQELIDKEYLFVATDGDAVVGYVVCADWVFLSQWPIFAYMVTLFDSFTFAGETMSVQNSYQYGPICVAASHRGQGVLQGLYDYARRAMAGRFPYGLTFINQRNPRSFAAHTKKLNLTVIREFGFNDQRYYYLGFLTRD